VVYVDSNFIDITPTLARAIFDQNYEKWLISPSDDLVTENKKMLRIILGE
jgi:hypothetical protein